MDNNRTKGSREKRKRKRRNERETLVYMGALKCFANQFATACLRGDKYQTDSDINASLYERTLIREHKRIGP